MLNIDLTGKVALITGTSSGIGLGIAKMLAKAGCHVSGNGRKEVSHEDAKSFIDIVKGLGVDALYTQTNVTQDDDLKKLVHHTVKKFGKIDFLVSNAGVNYFKGTEDCSDTDFDKNMNLNLRSHWKVSQLCKPYLEASDNGTIVIISESVGDIIQCGPKDKGSGYSSGIYRDLGNTNLVRLFSRPKGGTPTNQCLAPKWKDRNTR